MNSSLFQWTSFSVGGLWFQTFYWASWGLQKPLLNPLCEFSLGSSFSSPAASFSLSSSSAMHSCFSSNSSLLVSSSGTISRNSSMPFSSTLKVKVVCHRNHCLVYFCKLCTMILWQLWCHWEVENFQVHCNLWDHRHICGPLIEILLCGLWLYFNLAFL